jgi:hypothetical protein
MFYVELHLAFLARQLFGHNPRFRLCRSRLDVPAELCEQPLFSSRIIGEHLIVLVSSMITIRSMRERKCGKPEKNELNTNELEADSPLRRIWSRDRPDESRFVMLAIVSMVWYAPLCLESHRNLRKPGWQEKGMFFKSKRPKLLASGRRKPADPSCWCFHQGADASRLTVLLESSQDFAIPNSRTASVFTIEIFKR